MRIFAPAYSWLWVQLAFLLWLLPPVAHASQVGETSGHGADSALIRWLGDEGLPLFPARQISLYADGASTFDAIFSDIDRAQRKVWVEFMIVANDSIGNALLSHLHLAAERGCDVRLMVDDYKDYERGYGFRRPATRDSIRQLGIDFQLFDRFHYPWFNHVCRDHRKLVIVDDSIGYIGGLNVADYYIHGKPEFGGWRDTHCRITGAAVEGMAQLFAQHYRASGGERPYCFARYLFDADYAEGQSVDGVPAGDAARVAYFERSRATTKLQSQTRRAIVAALDAAQDTIRLVSPYLLPTHTVRQAILRAIDRGVCVQVMFSRVGDNPMLSYGNYHFAQRMIRHGAQVFLYRGKFHHSKIIMVDGRFCMIGSANLNSRSLKWDYEASAFIFSPGVTQRLTATFVRDLTECDVLTPQLYRSEFPRSQRIAGWWIDRFLTPFL